VHSRYGSCNDESIFRIHVGVDPRGTVHSPIKTDEMFRSLVQANGTTATIVCQSNVWGSPQLQRR
jgi:hypothetical protein